MMKHVNALFPTIEPFESGMLDVGDGNELYYEVCGNPDGKPALVLHGGPGSGCTPRHRRYFDPQKYKIVLFDQRNCGRSIPHASDHTISLDNNKTINQLHDIELLRTKLGVDSWVVFGASWGTTLALAYAQMFPANVRAMVLNSVVTTSQKEVDWITRGVGGYLPEEYKRFIDLVPKSRRDNNIAAEYSALLESDDAKLREEAAKRWCDWEDRHVFIGMEYHHDARYDDADFRLAFARIVTHYWSHGAWLRDNQLIEDGHNLAGIPGVLIHGAKDISSPLAVAESVHKAWPGSELIVNQDGGHSLVVDEIISATNKFDFRP